MAYGIPDANGNFVNDSDLESAKSAIHPLLALLGLTDPKIVMQKFHVVCVFNQPLSPSNRPLVTPYQAGRRWW